MVAMAKAIMLKIIREVFWYEPLNAFMWKLFMIHTSKNSTIFWNFLPFVAFQIVTIHQAVAFIHVANTHFKHGFIKDFVDSLTRIFVQTLVILKISNKGNGWYWCPNNYKSLSPYLCLIEFFYCDFRWAEPQYLKV